MSKEGNFLEPVVDAIWDTGVLIVGAIPKLLDAWGNLVYRIVEGKKYEGDMEDIEGFDIYNKVKYEYVPNEIFTGIRQPKKIVYEYTEGEKEGIKACIGVNMLGEKVWFNMLNSHTLVGGSARWGKSSFLNVFITSIMLTYTPNEVFFLGCDYKKGDVYYYRKYKFFNGMATDKQQFLIDMKAIRKECEKRSKILEESNCRNVIKYNKVSEKKLSYIIYAIDELPQVVADKTCMEELHSVMSLVPAFGIYFILATQDCTKATIGKCKMNCSQTVAFHTRDSTDSETLIGKGYNLQDITVKGRCYYDSSEDIIESQIYFLEEEEIEELLKPYLKEGV